MIEKASRTRQSFHLYEDNSRIITEDGDVVRKRRLRRKCAYIRATMPTLRSLNKIAFQNCYKISYYILDETSDTNDEDKILLEDAISAVLSETSVSED